MFLSMYLDGFPPLPKKHAQQVIPPEVDSDQSASEDGSLSAHCGHPHSLRVAPWVKGRGQISLCLL